MEKNTPDLVKELFATVEIIGVAKTFKKLKEAQGFNSAKADTILKAVCESVDCTKDFIIYGVERSDARREAMLLSSYFLKTEGKYTFSQIRFILQKNEAVIYRYYRDINKILQKKALTPLEKSVKENANKIKIILNQNKIK